jgi:hypothetical protein
MNFTQLNEQRLELIQRNLVWAVAEGLGGLGMSFNENSVAARSNRRARQNRGQYTVSGSAIPTSPRPLYGMCGIENHAAPKLADPVQGPHVCNQIVVSKTGPPLREKKPIAPEGPEFVGDVAHILRSKKLALFNVYNPSRFGRGFN